MYGAQMCVQQNSINSCLQKKKKSKEKKKSVISSKTNKIQIAFISNCLRNTWGRPIQFHLTLPSFIFIFIFILIFCHLLFKQSNKSEFNLAKVTMYTTIFNYMIIQRVFGVLRSLFDRPKCCVFEHGFWMAFYKVGKSHSFAWLTCLPTCWRNSCALLTIVAA